MAARLNVNVNDFTAAALEELAAKKSTTLTEIIRRSSLLLKFLEDVDQDDTTIILESKGIFGVTDRHIVTLG